MTEPQAITSGEPAISFGPFHVFPKQRLLLEGDKLVRLGSRAWDILIALIERPGEPVSREELMTRVWPDTVVVEGNLPVHMAALRRALGDGHNGNRYVVTIPGRGYSFAAPIKIAETPRPVPPQPADIAHGHNLPVQLTRLIGRADIVSRLAGQLGHTHLLTITGPPGIGKTSVALAVAEQLIGAYEHGVWLIDLAPLGDPLLVPSAVASVLGLESRSENPLPGLVAALRDKQMLLVLDNCGHVIEVATSLAIAVLRGAPGIRFLATSREPMRAQGEHVYRLSTLESPPAATPPSAAEVLRFPAVQLFVERATAATGEFKLSDADAPTIADICRKLDGLPLAIEFAAARVETFGVPGLAARMDDRFRLLSGGHRTALPRHQTMGATLDWSYSLLTEAERVILRRVAVFVGAFSLEAATAVVASAELTPPEVVEGVVDLVAKSLVSANVEDTGARYRLLDTTRAYAQEKLIASGEFQVVARRHAEFFRDFFERVKPEQAKRPMPERLADYGRAINDVRAALDWAFSPAGDATLGVALTVASERLWFGLSLMDECRRRVESALSSLRADVSGDTRLEMQLCAALGAAVYYAKGPCPEVCAAWTDVLTLAERLDDNQYRLRALWGLQSHHTGSGELRVALTLAQRLAGLPPNQAGPTDLLVGERLLGSTLHFMGDLSNARRHLEHVLSRYPASMAPSDPEASRFEWSRRSAACGSLVPVLWLQGFPDQAMRMAQAYVEEARATGHPVSLCWALYAACPIALAVGDLVTAERYVAMLLEHSARHAPGFLQALAHGLQGELLIKRGDAVGGVQCLRIALEELRANGFVLRRPALLGALAEGLAAAGNVAEGVLAIQEAVAQCERSDELWNIAELLRLKGELLLREGTEEAPTAAEAHLLQALDWARRQGALSWELRGATSLARLLKERGRTGAARELLSAAYDRFTEGFDTADLKNAKALLESLFGRGSQPSEL